MMKKLFIIVTVILLLPCSLLAQDEGRPQVLFNGGLTLQLGPDEFKDMWTPGFNFGMGLDIYLTYKWDLNLSFGYNRFFLKEDKYKSAFGYGNNIRINGYGSSVLTVSLNGKYILVE
ncbi:MAG: hypothetical protein GY863_06585, partial [bacterium]|nr:hypothetical protein [bacterium]